MFPIKSKFMKKKVIKKVLKVISYLIPAIIGWIEGDSHAIVDSLSAIISLF